MSLSRRSIGLGLLLLLGVSAPLVAHQIGMRCWVYLPAHVPGLLAGLCGGPVWGLAVAAATVLSDGLFGGRLPGVAFLPVGAELLTYGIVARLLAQGPPQMRRALVALLLAMVAGRLVYTAGATLLVGKELSRALRGAFLTSWPGALLQIAVLPALSLWARRRIRSEHPR